MATPSPYGRPLSDSRESAPKPLHGHARPNGLVTVAYALPGLRRAHVAVPDHRFVRTAGERLAGPLARLLAELDRQEAAQAGRVPGA